MVLVLVTVPSPYRVSSTVSITHTAMNAQAISLHSQETDSQAQMASHADGGVGDYSLQGVGFWPLKVNQWPLERPNSSYFVIPTVLQWLSS